MRDRNRHFVVPEEKVLKQLKIDKNRLRQWREGGLPYLEKRGKRFYDPLEIQNWVMWFGRDVTPIWGVLINQLTSVFKEWPTCLSGCFGETFRNPKRREVRYKIKLPSEVIKAGQTIRLWMPYPLEYPSQRDIKLMDVVPEPQTVRICDGHGVIFNEIVVREDQPLEMSERFSYYTYETHFNIDPDTIKDHDKTDPENSFYISKDKHLRLNNEITNLSHSIIKAEKNPILAARAICKWILENYTYGAVHHEDIENETDFILRKRYGDCGTMSFLLISLARSIGIPARLIGGFLVSERLCSPHAWAEILLPNLEWFPIDVSAAWAVKNWLGWDENKALDAFFGHLDGNRLILFNGTYPKLFPPKRTRQFMVFQIGEAETENSDLTEKLQHEITLLVENDI